MPSVSKKQQRFFGIVSAAQKGTLKGKKTLEVQRAAASMKEKDVKKFASTKHKGLPERKKVKVNEDAKMAKQSDDKLKAAHTKFSSMDKSPANTFMLKRIQREMNRRKKNLKYSMKEDYVKELEDGLVKMDYPTYDEVDKLMCKIAKDNDIDTTTLHMAFKTKHLMVPDDWAKKKMMEPVMIPKTPEGLKEDDGNYHMNKIARERGYDLTDPRQRRKANSIARQDAAKRNINNPAGFSKRKKKRKIQIESNDIERIQAAKKSAETVKLNQKPANQFSTGKKVSRETLKRMNKPENQFEGMKYGMYKGSGEPGGAMKAYLERKKKEKKQVKEEQNPEGIKLGDVQRIKREKQLADKQKQAPVVTNKIVSTSKLRTEGSLHKWFKGSKSKDGKGGWVNVVTGGTCASDEPGEGTPKCVSSSKRASMTKAERLSASRRKKKADPGQQSKSGAAKPTYVATDKHKKKKVSEEFGKLTKEQEKIYSGEKAGKLKMTKQVKKNLSSNTKDEFSNNESYSANPAQQAAIAIAKKNRQQDLKVAEKKKLKEYKDVPQGQINYAAFNKPKPKSYEMDSIKRQYSGKDYKPEDKKNVIKYNQKVNSSFEPNEELVEGTPAWQRKAGKSESGGLNAKGVASYRAANPGSKLKTAVTTKPSKLKKGSKSAKRRKSFCSRMKGMKAKLTSAKTARDPDSRINKSLRKWNCSFEPDHGEVISEGKVAKMIKSLKRKTKVLEKGQKKTRDAGAIAAKIMKQKEHNKYVNFLPMDEEKKKCGEGEYYCNDDKKCKPIPKGYKIGYGGYLKPENENDESNGKKGGSNGNGNGHGGNGNGHGGNGNGGNGGGNGGGE